MRYEKGEYIGGYKISLPLNTGGGKEVYRVRDPKGLLSVLITGGTQEEREAASCSPLFRSQAESFYLLSHISGETLEARLRREKQLTSKVALSVANDLQHQLESLHKRGFAHNGVEASNVMIDVLSQPVKAYLIGFGKASRSESFEEDLKALGRLVFRMTKGEELPDNAEMPVGVLADGFKSETELEDFTARDFKRSPSGPGFEAVAGMDELKNSLRQDVVEILADKEEAKKYGLSIPNGMLLYGPPGCGKTFIAERFAEEAGYNYQYIKSSDLASVYLHGSQEKIAQLFDAARRHSPTILCFDEFDALVPRRDDINNASQSAEVNEFLSQLNNCGSDGIFVIATSNRPDKIDPAVLRSGRMDLKIYVPVPDMESRAALFRIMLKEKPTADDIDCNQLAKKTEGFVASDITAVVMAAAREAFRKKIAISLDLLLESINRATPSLSKSDISYYEKMRAVFEKKDDTEKKRSAGFL